MEGIGDYVHPACGLGVSRATELLCETADALGIDWQILDPRHGFLVKLSKSGISIILNSSVVTPNSHLSYHVASDKVYTYIILSKAGFAVPRGDYFFKEGHFTNPDYSLGKGLREAEGYANWLAQQTGYPIVVKPVHLTQALGVSVVSAPEEIPVALRKAVEVPGNSEYLLIVQEFIRGEEYRLMYLDGQVVLCYRKTDFGTIANLSSGARAIVETERMHPSYSLWADRVCQVLGLCYAGIDLRCADISQPAVTATVLEVNGNPGLTHFSRQGPREHEIAVSIYKKLLTRHFDKITQCCS